MHTCLFFTSDEKGNTFGLFLCKGRAWRDLRRFTYKALSNLGMGRKDTMENIILEV